MVACMYVCHAMLCDSVMDTVLRLVTKEAAVRPMIVHVWLVVISVEG